MKEIARKLTRYSTAAGALLAVSAGAQANPHFGIMTGSDGNLTLNHDNDRVFIDVNNDGKNDFFGVMFTTTTSTSFYSTSYGWYYYTFLYKTVFFASNWFSDNGAYDAVELDGPTTIRAKKFFMNDRIGPLSNEYYYGLISNWSGPAGSGGPYTTPALGTPFSSGGDEGYIGFSTQLSDNEKYYGWANVLLDGYGNVEFIAAALENRNQVPILAGDSTPVPLLPIASAAGLGLVGLMAALKRRKKNVTL